MSLSFCAPGSGFTFVFDMSGSIIAAISFGLDVFEVSQSGYNFCCSTTYLEQPKFCLNINMSDEYSGDPITPPYSSAIQVLKLISIIL